MAGCCFHGLFYSPLALLADARRPLGWLLAVGCWLLAVGCWRILRRVEANAPYHITPSGRADWPQSAGWWNAARRLASAEENVAIGLCCCLPFLQPPIWGLSVIVTGVYDYLLFLHTLIFILHVKPLSYGETGLTIERYQIFSCFSRGWVKKPIARAIRTANNDQFI